MTQYVKDVINEYTCFVEKFNDASVVDLTDEFVEFLNLLLNANIAHVSNPVTAEEHANIRKLFSGDKSFMMFDSIPPVLPEYCIRVAIMQHFFKVLKGYSKIKMEPVFSSDEWREYADRYGVILVE